LTSSEFGHIIRLVKLKKERYNMTNKTFKFVGSSVINGKTKLRFANDIMRIKVLDKNGHALLVRTLTSKRLYQKRLRSTVNQKFKKLLQKK
jgi:hypothetical protein